MTPNDTHYKLSTEPKRSHLCAGHLPNKIDKINRTAGSDEPKYSANFSMKGAAIFSVGGSSCGCVSVSVWSS